MKRILLISIALAVLLGASCKEATEPEVPDYYGATPAECIYNLELSFNARDISIFEKQLAPDFTFWFSPLDVGHDVNGYIIPSSWGYDHMRRAVWNIIRPYDQEGGYDVAMQLPENDVGTPPEGATTYTAENIGISLLVMVDEDNGFIANMGTLEFAFEKANNGSEDYWRITDWRDFTYMKKGVESADLGMILATFYAANPLDPTE
jgi:hypothetical protein